VEGRRKRDGEFCFDVTIIGAGASGMACAILLARCGVSVALIEKQSRGGKKILASGNGKCNITNTNLLPKHFLGKNDKLIKSLLGNCSFEKIEEFFNSLGLEFDVKDDGKAYPKSHRASIVLELLEQEIKRLGVKIFYNVDNLKVDNNFSIKFNKNTLNCKQLIIATGSKAAPQLGGDISGLEIAKKFGHNIIKPLPALVPLTSNSKICKALSGVKVKASVKLVVNNTEKSSRVEDLLFTPYGVSGLAILDLSFDAVVNLYDKKDVKIVVDFFPDINRENLQKYLKQRIDKKRSLPLKLWLGAIMDSKLASYLVDELNLSDKTENNLNTKTVKEIVNICKAYEIEISGYREFKYAEVARGGVDTRELTENLESKRVKGLYFIGEVTDIVGKRGGYNFSFAWCSAFRVSETLLEV